MENHSELILKILTNSWNSERIYASFAVQLQKIGSKNLDFVSNMVHNLEFLLVNENVTPIHTYPIRA